MPNTIKTYLQQTISGLFNSYSQIYFSQNKWFAGLLLLVTFFYPAGACMGLLSVVIVNILANIAGFNKQLIADGFYGFSALLLGIALRYKFDFSASFLVLLLFALVLLLICMGWLQGFFTKFKLPFLSFPFLFSYWIVSLAANSFSHIHVADVHGFYLSSSSSVLAQKWFSIVHSLDAANLPELVKVYFNTLASVFFVKSLLGGILVAAGLLYHSRILFSLTVLGFTCAYFFYVFFGADVNHLNYLGGSNFIFFSIALGAFFVIPNKWSYLSVILLTPLLLFIIIFLNQTLHVLNLEAFTISFSLLTIAFLYMLQQGWLHKYLKLVQLQYYSPEKTIYKYVVSKLRFKHLHYAKVFLPFWGDWKVTQGYNGGITHLEKWAKALDFSIVDEHNNTYKNNGFQVEDFYCFNKPVLAPMDGYVYEIINIVEDNEVAQVNTEKNWGNTVILNHLNGLYSQISHIKKDSFKVAVGDYIQKGNILATCGNSGRSPEPHIHFQLQSHPRIGAETLHYPIAYFIEKNGAQFNLKISEVPKENAIISNVETTELITKSFDFIPGRKIVWRKENETALINWEVFTDAYNRKYIYCSKTQSTVWFENDGTLFYCYDFEGDTTSLLFQFYVAAYKIIQGCYLNLKVTDIVPSIYFNNKGIRFIQDFIAPFYNFTTVNYSNKCIFADNEFAPESITLKTDIAINLLNQTMDAKEFVLELRQTKIHSFIIKENKTNTTYICEGFY